MNHLIAILAIIFLLVARPSTPTFSLVIDQDYHTTQHSPAECYGDDHGVYWQAKGTLSGIYTYTSRLPVCFGHQMKFHIDSNKPLIINAIDQHGLSLTTKMTYTTKRTYIGGVLHSGKIYHYQGCNTDDGYWRAYRYPEGSTYVSGFEFQPWVYVTWTITAPIDTIITANGWLSETPSPTPTGGEGSWDWCTYPAPD